MARKAVCASALLVLGGQAMAHHGAYEYDFATVSRIQGKVTAYHWRNPHAFVHLLTRNEAGALVEVVIETEGPSGLTPLGVTKRSVQPGERVVATVFRHRRSPTSALGRDLVKQDGTVVPLHPRFADDRLERATGTAVGIGGVWVPRRRDFFAWVSERGRWPFTPAAAAALDAYDVTQSPQVDCKPLSAPTIMLFPTVHTFTVHDDHIVMNADWLDAERTIFTDGRPHPPADQRFYQGHSVGRWDGDVLVVDTANFTPHPSGLSFGVPSSADKRLQEWMRISGDRTALEVEYVLTDPASLTEPLQGSYQWTFRADLEPSRVPCDLDAAHHFLEIDAPRRALPP